MKPIEYVDAADRIVSLTATVDVLISIVVPCHDEIGNLESLYRRVRNVMAQQTENWEMVCVNDGSRDQTLAQLLALRREDARVIVIDLSRNFGKEAALTAGLKHARGQAIIPLDADLQDPPELIPELIAKWRDGYDVVNAVRITRDGDGWLKRITSHIFYRVLNRLSHVDIPPDTGDFRLITRPVLEAILSLPERRRFMKGLFAWVGFRTIAVPYQRSPRHAGRSKWNYWKLWNFAIEGITSFSIAPLQLASYSGFVVSLFAFAYAAWVVIQTLIYGNPIKGYPSLMATLLFLGGVQLMALGVIGEYLGRIYEESKQRPLYLVRRTWPDRETGGADMGVSAET
jgi:glycosyltransferase involved in cell wall biosynthesis